MPLNLRRIIIEKEEKYTNDLESWKKQKWHLDPEDFQDVQRYCLPTIYQLPPVIYAQKRTILTIGELDYSKLPKLKWKENLKTANNGNTNNKAEYQEPFGIFVDQK